jgi:hypothetical protein
MEGKNMRLCFAAGILVLLFLTGCVPDLVSVSRDGTIALTLKEDGKFEPLEGKDQRVYLTNASADFLTKVEGLDGCLCPQISPSGRFIVAVSEDGLVLYDRETKERRVFYTCPEEADDWSVNFPVWSPDEKKIAFFVGNFDDDPPGCRLTVYDVERRELIVLARRACPRATWRPDSKHLLYVSFPPGASKGGGEPPFGDLKMVSVTTGKRKTLARRQLFSYTRIAAFPKGNAILFPCVRWDDAQVTREGVTAPLVLNKEVIPAPEEKKEERSSDREEEAKPAQPEQSEAKRDVEKPQPAAGEEKPQEQGFILEEGQPFHPYICEVSPDGERIAYARAVGKITGFGDFWPAKPREAEGEEPVGPEAEPKETDSKSTELEGWEVCVAGADGTGSVALARSTDDEFLQVLWVSDSRLICVTDKGILAVDADGQNKLDLIEAIGAKFADQFGQGADKEDAPPNDETK